LLLAEKAPGGLQAKLRNGVDVENSAQRLSEPLYGIEILLPASRARKAASRP
jgi:hypothetical protein